MSSKREKHLRREKARIAATSAPRFGRVHHDRSRPIAACPQCGGHYGTYV